MLLSWTLSWTLSCAQCSAMHPFTRYTIIQMHNTVRTEINLDHISSKFSFWHLNNSSTHFYLHYASYNNIRVIYCDIWVCISLFSNIWQTFLHAMSAMLFAKVFLLELYPTFLELPTLPTICNLAILYHRLLSKRIKSSKPKIGSKALIFLHFKMSITLSYFGVSRFFCSLPERFGILDNIFNNI